MKGRETLLFPTSKTSITVSPYHTSLFSLPFSYGGIKNMEKKKANPKKDKKYPYVYPEEMEFHKRIRKPTIHIDEKTGKEYVMVRKSGGGTKRMYDWKKYLVSNLKKKKKTTKAKTSNPTKTKLKTAPKRKKTTKKKEDNSIFYLIGAGILGFLGYKIYKKQKTSAQGTTSGKRFQVNAFNKLKRR